LRASASPSPSPCSGNPISTDWLDTSSVSGVGGLLNDSGVPKNTTVTYRRLDPANCGNVCDDAFSGGKLNDDPNLTWQWLTGASNVKTDMNNVYVHISKGNNPGADRWITASADRLSNNGTAYIDFEFLQKTLTKNVQTGCTKPPCGGFTSAGTQGGRTVGDILVTAQYGSGGSLGTILTYRWEETPPLSGVFQYVEHTSNIPAGAAYVATSLVPGPLDGGHPPGPGIPVPYGAFGDPLYAYSQNQFVEVSIDLATVIGALAGDSCTGIQVSTVMIKTKTSTATNATQEDLIEPIQVSF